MDEAVRPTLVFGEDGELLSSDDLAVNRVCTGDGIAAFSKEAVLETLDRVVVPGDVLGTGQMNIGQVVRLAQAVNGSAPLEGAYLQAAKLTEDDDLNIADLVLLASRLNAAA